MARERKPQPKKSSHPPPPAYLRELLYEKDTAIAEQKVKNRAAREFNASEKGKRLDQVETEFPEIEARYLSKRGILEELERKRDNTAKYGTEPNKVNAIAFKHWKMQDQINFLLLNLCLIAALFMGSANIYATLMNEITYMENPWLAVILSAFLPAGAMGVKFISAYFEFDKTKRRYALLVYSLTAIFMIAWSAAFALNFNGASSGIDWETLGEGDGSKGALLVFLQITCELLIAASIFLAIDFITTKYAPDSKRVSQDWIIAEKTIEEHIKAYTPLRNEYLSLSAEKSTLQKEREALSEDWADQYRALYNRLNAADSM